ncbi:MAG: HU family DNA-binding protein [Candidatus Dojkabacteria bacterium]|jgi:DNA-binding protein HU-beta|nr:HU family DNA-binding protein [Candidatus Dojkabacteria bacterium]
MNKMDLVNMLADKTGMTKKGAAEALDTVLGAVMSALKKGEKVTITGFGTFEVRSRKARTGRNPQTGSEITIPARKVAAFRAGKALKDAVK